MSHLCTMHRPPLSKEWTGGAHFGERNSRRSAHPSCPFKAPTTPQPHPPPCGRGVVGRGAGTFLGASTFHVTPQFLTKEKEEFSTCPSSGLSWRDKRHAQGESCGRVTYFQVSIQTQCPPWRIRSQTRRRSCVATAVSSTVGAKSLRAHSPQKGCATKLVILS